MTETHFIEDEPLDEFFERIDWSFVKRVIITKLENGQYHAEIIHYRSGKYMFHAFKHERRSPQDQEKKP